MVFSQSVSELSHDRQMDGNCEAILYYKYFKSSLFTKESQKNYIFQTDLRKNMSLSILL